MFSDFFPPLSKRYLFLLGTLGDSFVFFFFFFESPTFSLLISNPKSCWLDLFKAQWELCYLPLLKIVQSLLPQCWLNLVQTAIYNSPIWLLPTFIGISSTPAKLQSSEQESFSLPLLPAVASGGPLPLHPVPPGPCSSLKTWPIYYLLQTEVLLQHYLSLLHSLFSFYT